MASGQLGSHNAQARPDEKMSRRQWKFRKARKRHPVDQGSPGEREATKKVANAKRRQHDRKVINDA